VTPLFSEVELAISTVSSLIGSLGPSSAAVFVCWIFVQYLLKRGEAEGRRDEQMLARFEQLGNRFEAQCQAQSKHYEEFINRQAEVIRENSAALRDWRHGGTAPPRAKP
jgi:hypothetical protein